MIEVSFLPVGHTHEDIYQAFGQISNHLQHNDAITLKDLHTEVCKTSQCFCKQYKRTWKMVWFWPDLESYCETVPILTLSILFVFVCAAWNGTKERFSTYSETKVNVWKEWRSFCKNVLGYVDGNLLASSFLQRVWWIAFTPPTETFVSIEWKEWQKLEIEENRINCRQKWNQLFSICDMVFHAHVEIFHWNLSCAIKPNKTSVNGLVSYNVEMKKHA